MIWCIIGKSCSGKTTLAKQMETSFKRVITTTTRPKRDYETDGIDYHFVDEDMFEEKLINGDFVESDCFRGWYYGTAVEYIEDNSVVVVTPKGAKKIAEKFNNVIVCYLDIPSHIRLQRALDRGDDLHEIIRRYYADEIDFYDMDIDYIVVKDICPKEIGDENNE